MAKSKVKKVVATIRAWSLKKTAFVYITGQEAKVISELIREFVSTCPGEIVFSGVGRHARSFEIVFKSKTACLEFADAIEGTVTRAA